MVYAKRLWIAILFGIITGLLCAYGGKWKMGDEMTTAMMWGTIFNRAFIGLAIGISAWKLGWFFHGIVIGFLGTLPMSVYAEDFGEFIILSLFGILWGFVIELFTTAIFKAPMKTGAAST
ncbi:MAG: hypothetical protein FJY66_00135 [Calditrichaeota bacterium]|nr:hypothetical protein [Calditrichota bacterium]